MTATIDKKGSELDAAGSLSGIEAFPFSIPDANGSATAAVIAAYANAGVARLAGTVDPSAAGGVAAAIGSSYTRTDDGTEWKKTSSPATGWQRLAFA